MPPLNQLTIQMQRLTLFQGLDAESVAALVRAAHFRTYAAGEIVALEGERAPGLFLLASGWLKAVKYAPGGREQVLRFLEPGETFNEIGVFADQPNPATAIALEPAGVWILPRAAITELLRSRPAFAQYVIERLAERLIYLVDLVTDLSLRTLTGRLARLILDSASGDTLHRPHWYTQAELAARLGTVPDVAQRALRQLEQNGLIAVDRNAIRILDRNALEQAAQ